MILFFRLCRDVDDDGAPIDYTVVASVAEGTRRLRSQTIHPQNAPRANVRHVAYPQDYGIPDDPFAPSGEPVAPRRSRAERAMPAPQPAAPAPAPAADEAARGARIAMPSRRPVMTADDGSQFEAPLSPDVPDWLRVAQHNNMPLTRPDAPRVQSAPRQNPQTPLDPLGRPMYHAAAQAPRSAADLYQEAGYPQQLLDMQQQLEHEQAEMTRRRRRGAQFAVPLAQPQSPARPAAPAHTSYPPQRPAAPARRTAPACAPDAPAAAPQPSDLSAMPRAQAYTVVNDDPQPYLHRPVRTPAAQDEPANAWRDAETDDAPMYQERSRVPWLPIVVLVMAVAAVVLLVLHLTFSAQTQEVLDARLAHYAAIREDHPRNYVELIEQKAYKYNLSPAYVTAIVMNESSFRPQVENASTGARGLMQLMDDTAGWIHTKLGVDTPYSFDALFDPATNLEYGCWYLSYLSQEFWGDPVLVTAAYHAGQGKAREWLAENPTADGAPSLDPQSIEYSDTRRYVNRVLGDYATYRRLYYQMEEQP